MNDVWLLHVETIFTNLQLKVALIKDMGRKIFNGDLNAKIFEVDVWLQKYFRMRCLKSISSQIQWKIFRDLQLEKYFDTY